MGQVEVKAINRAIELRNQGLKQSEIATILNNEGIKLNGTGRPWTQTDVSNVLCRSGLRTLKPRKKRKMKNQTKRTKKARTERRPPKEVDSNMLKLVAKISISEDFTKTEKQTIFSHMRII